MHARFINYYSVFTLLFYCKMLPVAKFTQTDG